MWLEEKVNAGVEETFKSRTQAQEMLERELAYEKCFKLSVCLGEEN